MISIIIVSTYSLLRFEIPTPQQRFSVQLSELSPTPKWQGDLWSAAHEIVIFIICQPRKPSLCFSLTAQLSARNYKMQMSPELTWPHMTSNASDEIEAELKVWADLIVKFEVPTDDYK